MTVTAVRKDPHRLTMTIEAEFDASPERVWQLWADPRQLERWWGPPNFPATVTQHNLAPGGRVEYGMMGPQGDRHRGYWEILEAEAPHRLVFRDGLASADGTPNTDMPLATTRVTIEEVDVLRYEDVQVPVPAPGEVRVRVASTAFIDDSGVAAASERVGNRSQAAAWRVPGLPAALLRGVPA